MDAPCSGDDARKGASASRSETGAGKVWASLSFSELDRRGRKPSGVRVVVAIPKKVVRLATDRNRLRRLFREATRKHPSFERPGIYFFRVLRRPPQAELNEIRKILA